MINRRNFILCGSLGLWVAPLVARAQPTKTVRRIGVLSPGPALSPAQYQGVWTPLRELGWVEGQNLAFERRWADGKPERLRPLADELVRFQVELIVTIGTDATVAARNATASVPIVMLSAADPVGAGLVVSLARPGGNVTGISMTGPEVETKRLALLRELLPRVQQVGVLVDPTTAVSGYSRNESEAAYRSLGLRPIFVEVTLSGGVLDAVAQVARRGGEALVVHRDVLFLLNGVKIMDAAMTYRLPAVVEDRSMLEAGGLMSYVIDEDDQLKRFATFVDRILRGAKPSDLPVEQPTKFELGINLKTAKALGLVVPQSLLLRADELIQ
jgi:putative ABC transport system substrate-binding protein